MVAVSGLSVKSVGFFAILLLCLLASFGFANLASGLYIDINVSARIKGSYYLVNRTSGPVQEFYVAWENRGSVGCSALPRIIFYNASNETGSVYTAWAERRDMWPGDEADWFFYSTLPPGNYTSKVRIRYCREDFNYGPYGLEVPDYGEPENDILEIVGNKTFENYVELTLRSNQTLRDITVVPIEYPTAWAFGSDKVDVIEKGEEKTARLFYEPTIWKESKVKIRVMTMDGKHSTEASIVLVKEKERGLLENLLYFLSSVKEMILQLFQA